MRLMKFYHKKVLKCMLIDPLGALLVALRVALRAALLVALLVAQLGVQLDAL